MMMIIIIDLDYSIVSQQHREFVMGKDFQKSYAKAQDVNGFQLQQIDGNIYHPIVPNLVQQQQFIPPNLNH